MSKNNRSDELRSMMKFQKHTSSVTAGGRSVGGLTGKDKAKMLKLKKGEEKQKQTVTINLAKLRQSTPKKTDTSSGPPPGFFDEDSSSSATKKQKVEGANFVSTSNSFTASTGPSTVPTSSSSSSSLPPAIPAGLPTNFFDDVAAPSVPITKDNTATIIVNHTKSQDLASTKMKNTIADKINKSDLPSGFFDDVEGDLKARGVSMKQFQELQEQQAQEELTALLGEVTAIHDHGEAVVAEEIENEEQAKEFEDSVMQMAYMSKLAILYKDTDRLADKLEAKGADQLQNLEKLNASSSSSGAFDDGALATLIESSVSGVGGSSSSLGTGGSSIREDVQMVLNKKLQSVRDKNAQQGGGQEDDGESGESGEGNEGSDDDSDGDSEGSYCPLDYF